MSRCPHSTHGDPSRCSQCLGVVVERAPCADLDAAMASMQARKDRMRRPLRARATALAIATHAANNALSAMRRARKE